MIQEQILDEVFETELGLADESHNFNELMKAAEPGGALSSYTIEIFGNHGRSRDQLNFMTLHSSKGLEFQAVFILGLEEEHFLTHTTVLMRKRKKRLVYLRWYNPSQASSSPYV